MNVYSAVYSYLSAQVPVTTLVSTRIYPLHLPQDPVIPAIVVTQVAEESDHHLTGKAGHSRATLKFACLSQDMQEAFDIAEALRGVMQGYRGTMGSYTVGSITLQNVYDDAEALDDGSEDWVYARTHEYTLSFRQS
jgi:hypothetical protein